MILVNFILKIGYYQIYFGKFELSVLQAFDAINKIGQFDQVKINFLVSPEKMCLFIDK